MEIKRQLNLKMDGKNEWRLDTSMAIKRNDSNTTYGLRYLLNHQLPTAETPGKEHFNFIRCSPWPLSVTECFVNWIQYGRSYVLDSNLALCNLDYTKTCLSALTRMDHIFIKATRGGNKAASFKSVLRLLGSLG